MGTFALPESQLDRFMMRLSMGYPTAEAELQLYAGGDRRRLLPKLQAATNAETLLQWQQQVAEIKLSAAAVQYVYRLVQATRAPGRFAVGLSPRAGLAVVAAAKAWAFIEGRAHVLPEDIKAVWVAVAAHRVQALQAQSHSADVLTEMLTHVAVG